MSKYAIRDWFWLAEDLKVKAILRADSPYWHAQFNLPGTGQRRRSLKTKSKKQARLEGHKLVRRLVAGELDARARRCSVGEVAEERRRRLAELNRSPKTLAIIERFDRQLFAHLPRGADTPIDGLTTAVLEDFERKLRSEGIAAQPTQKNGRAEGASRSKQRRPRRPRPLAPKTLRDAMKWTRGLIRFALRRGMLARDPASAYELPIAGPRPIEVLDADALRTLYADPERGDIWRFYVEAALRARELIWMSFEDVVRDEAGEPVAVRVRAKNCPVTGERWSPKHGIERIVPLTHAAAGIAQRRLDTAPGPWLFTTPADDRGRAGRWSYQRLRRALQDRLRMAGVAPRGLHILRHTGATYMANDAGVPVTQLQRFLGHHDLKETMRYLNPRAEHITQTIRRVDFDALIENSHDNTDVNRAGDDGGAPPPPPPEEDESSQTAAE